MTQPAGYDGPTSGFGNQVMPGRFFSVALILCASWLIACPRAGATQPYLTALDTIEEAYLDNRYQDVVDDASALLRDLPGLDDALFLRGVAYWQLGNFSQARNDLTRYLESDGEFSEEARTMLEQLRVVRSPTLLYGARVGMIYSDRVLRPDVALDDPRRESEDAGIRLGWNVESVSDGVFDVQYRGSHLQYLTVEEASWHNEALNLIARWFTPSRNASLVWRNGGEYVRRKDGPDVWRLISRAEGTWAVIPGRHIGWSTIGVGYDKYPFDPEFSGIPFLVSGGFDHHFGRTSLYWDLYWFSHEAKDDALSFTENGGRLGVAYGISPTLSAGMALRALGSHFDRYERIFERNRSDDYVSIDAWASMRLGTFRINPFVEYTENDSNFEGLDFDRLIFGLDLIFGVL